MLRLGPDLSAATCLLTVTGIGCDEFDGNEVFSDFARPYC